MRTQAALIEIDLDAINFYAGDLREKLEVLHKELEFADPIKDRLFEKFMYKLQRFILALQQIGELKELATAMQEFGLPHASEVAEIIKSQRLASRPSVKAGFQPLITNAQKYLLEEPIHA